MNEIDFKIKSTYYCVWLYASDGRYIDAFSFPTYEKANKFICTHVIAMGFKAQLKITNIYDIVKKGETK